MVRSEKESNRAAFSSYIFAKVNETSRMQILEDPSIVSNVSWLGKPALVRDNEIRNFLEEFPLASIASNEFKSDDRVVVNSGPLSKFEGTVDQIKGNRAISNIESLGIVIHAEVSLNRREKIV